MNTKTLIIMAILTCCIPIYAGQKTGKKNEEKEGVASAKNTIIKIDNDNGERQTHQTNIQKQKAKDNEKSQLPQKNTIKKSNVEEVQFFEIIESKQQYKQKGKIVSGLPGLGMISGDSTINLQVKKDKDAAWRVITTIFNGKDLVMRSRTMLDHKGSVIDEDTYISESKGKDEMQKLTISIEEQPFMGKGKVIRLKNGKKDISELMVGLDEPITTFMQIIVWVSTIKAVPAKGLAFRWVINGNPLPVVLRELETEERKKVCYAIFSNISDSFSAKQPEEQPKPIACFLFSNERKEFTMPDELELIINSLSVVFKSEIVKE